MKKVVLLLVAVTPLFLSCDKEDNTSIDHQTVLLGKWEVKSFTDEYTINGQPYSGEDVEISAEDILGTVFEFKAGNIFSVTTYDSEFSTWDTETGTYVYNPSQNAIDYTFIESDGSTYTERMHVTSLTQNNLKFYLSDEEMYEGNVYKMTLNLNCDRKN